GGCHAVFRYPALAATRLQPSRSLTLLRGRWRALGKCSSKRMPKKGEISMRVNDRQMLFAGRFLVSLTKGAVRAGFALLLAGLLTASMAWSQGNQGTLEGTVVDQSGA